MKIRICLSCRFKKLLMGLLLMLDIASEDSKNLFKLLLNFTKKLPNSTKNCEIIK